MILETTLNRLRAHSPCVSGYATLLASLGGPACDPNGPINLLHILQSNGVDDCLWALRATIQDSEQVARLMASDFAELALPIFERARPTDARLRNTIAVARRYARGEATEEELSAARAAAGAAGAAAALAPKYASAAAGAAGAAAKAAARAARAAARDAAGAAGAAAWDGAGDGAGAGARITARAAAWNAQARIIRSYLRGKDDPRDDA
jgi:hypothetical protein